MPMASAEGISNAYQKNVKGNLLKEVRRLFVSVVSSRCHTYIPIYQAMDSSATHHS